MLGRPLLPPICMGSEMMMTKANQEQNLTKSVFQCFEKVKRTSSACQKQTSVCPALFVAWLNGKDSLCCKQISNDWPRKWP